MGDPARQLCQPDAPRKASEKVGSARKAYLDRRADRMRSGPPPRPSTAHLRNLRRHRHANLGSDGLKIKTVHFDSGSIRIELRNWRGDIDEPKTAKSRRTLALGTLPDRYRAWIGALKNRDPEAWVFPQRDDPCQPMWDSGVRKALKLAAAAEGCDFPGFGPHSLRRANITWQIGRASRTERE